MKKGSWLVSLENGVRPAGARDECFYCKVKLGLEHDPSCVLRKRTVVLKTTITHVVSFPEDWTAENIEFSRNESSRCAKNTANELIQLFEYCDKDENSCLCPLITSTYEREATEDDEKTCGVFIAEIES